MPQYNTMSLRETYGQGVADREASERNKLSMDATQQSMKMNEQQMGINQQNQSAALQRRNTEMLFAGISQVETNPRALPSVLGTLVQNKIMTPEGAQEMMQKYKADPQGLIAGLADTKAGLATELGKLPTAQYETIQAEDGSILQRDPTTGKMSQVQGRDQSAERLIAADRLARQRDADAEARKLADEQRKQGLIDSKKQEEISKVYATYKTSRDGLMKGLSGSNTGPLSGRLPAVTTGQQIAEGGIAAMAPVLKQIFRSAGEGVFTDKDQELLLNMVPKRTDSAEAREAKMTLIDSIVVSKLGISQPADQQEQPQVPRFVYDPATGQLVHK